MSDVDAKLMRCFQAVFPGMKAEQVVTASAETVQAWDSVALINLLNVIVEEFGIEIDWENLAGLTSYTAIREMLVERAAQA